MPLRDTLMRLHEAQVDEDRPARIAEWKKSVGALMEQLHGYLSEYERDGFVTVQMRRIRLTEEDLGTYDVPALDVRAGPALILIRPVGLMVVGAEGRVDMHRQGRPSDEHRIMLLHMNLTGPAYPPTWCIQFPADAAPRLDPLHPAMSETRKVAPLGKETFEAALDFLLA